MSKVNLTAKFGVYSLLVITATGIATGAVLIGQVRAQLFQDYVTRALAIQRAVVSHHVEVSDFKPGAQRLASGDFDRFVKESVVSKDFVFLRIIRRDGTVLYSNNRAVIGERLPIKTGLKTALSGRVDAEAEHLTERPKSPLLLEMYSPIKREGRVIGAFEAYFSLQPLYRRQREIIADIVALLAGGSALLWLTLFGLARGASVTIERQNAGLHRLSDHLGESLDKLEKNYLGTMESLARAVEARDPYTGGHSHRIESLCSAVARKLGLTAEEHRRLDRAGELHDIGKIGIPEAILTKPGALNPDEWGVMKKHPLVSADIIGRVPFLRHVAPIVRHHHEHFDGSGYPDGLTGAEIPLESRILSVIDAFDAMTSDRPYRKAFSQRRAFAILEENKGTQFDPSVVDSFVELLRERPDLLKLEAA